MENAPWRRVGPHLHRCARRPGREDPKVAGQEAAHAIGPERDLDAALELQGEAPRRDGDQAGRIDLGDHVVVRVEDLAPLVPAPDPGVALGIGGIESGQPLGAQVVDDVKEQITLVSVGPPPSDRPRVALLRPTHHVMPAELADRH